MLSDHLNAEIVASTISSKQDAMDYITWTYFFRRLLINPTYYGLDDTDHNSVNTFLSNLIEGAITALQMSYCVTVLEVWDVFCSLGTYENTSNDLFIESQSLHLKMIFSLSRFIEINRDMLCKIIVSSHLSIYAKWEVETLIREIEIDLSERFRRTVVFILSYCYRMNEHLSRLY